MLYDISYYLNQASSRNNNAGLTSAQMEIVEEYYNSTAGQQFLANLNVASASVSIRMCCDVGGAK